MKTIFKVIAVIVVVAILAFAYVSFNTSDTKIVISANSTLQNGDNITIMLKDDYRNVFPEQIIDFKILDASGWAHKYTITTDENGTGQVQLEGFDNGDYTAHAYFNGTMFLKGSKSSFTFAVDDGYSY